MSSASVPAPTTSLSPQARRATEQEPNSARKLRGSRITPTQDASGSVNRLGHISHEGPSTVRHLITEAAWHGTRLSPTIRTYFERIMQGNKERRKIALVATGHYLLRVMHAMLRDGTPWQESTPPASSMVA